ncbi:TVP38/TMEM64 family protein [Rossellomorea vietnamensis]|uniref:TVP38/TMEM64 family membrane protein n=2 Tax=Rossellomorea vietnamensis TaxID=218284 RepID=A0A5D4NXC7_9BACI|nr:TVP38/TMEM64 family protein [Rossellomorea vietnamensis]
MKQLFSLVLSGLIIFMGFTQKEIMLDLIQEGGGIAGVVSILFVAVLVFFPFIPYPVLAGILGSVAGVVNGTLISLIGILIGTTLMFYLSRYGFQSWSQRMLTKYPKAIEYERYFEKNAFLGILFVRLLPVVPSPVVNVLSGISKVNFLVFVFATLLGKLPAIFTFTIAGSIFEGNRLLSISIYGVYFLIIAAAASMHFYKKKSSLIIPSEKQVNT